MNDMKQKDNTMRETPETDAAFRDGYTFCAEDMMPAVAFCANLERERDEARELVRELRDALKKQQGLILTLINTHPTSLFSRTQNQVNATLTKAKEVLGEA